MSNKTNIYIICITNNVTERDLFITSFLCGSFFICIFLFAGHRNDITEIQCIVESGVEHHNPNLLFVGQEWII